MRQEAALLATLFLNFAFWLDHGNAFWLPYPLPVSALIVAAVSALLALMFLIGPALAVHRSGRGLFPALENSFGTSPTLALRLLALWFTFSFLSNLLRHVAWRLDNVFQRPTDWKDSLVTSFVLLLFLAYTALQSKPTTTELAKFTNRLSIAVLLVAIIRLHEVWPTTLPILLTTGPGGAYFLPKHHVSKLAFDLAPLGLLASAYAQRLTSEKEVLRTATLGFALPVGASLFVMSAINFATSQSSLYQPSLIPNIAMALWGDSAASAKTGPAMIALLTTFGAFRFGIRSIPTIIPNPRFHLPAVFTILALSLANLAWGEYTKQVTFPPDFDPPAVVLAIVTAILSADALHNRPTESKQIDWPATTALIAAFAAAYSIAQSGNPALNPWWRPWIFPSYITAFTITLAGRKLQRS